MNKTLQPVLEAIQRVFPSARASRLGSVVIDTPGERRAFFDCAPGPIGPVLTLRLILGEELTIARD